MSADLTDIMCDPNNPRKIYFDDIQAATRRIAGALAMTPCTRAHMADKLGMDLYFKQEFMHYTGSFKERGVRNTLMNLSEEQKKYGVVSATRGNHGFALSYHAALLGIPCVVVLPADTGIYKVNKTEQLGSKVVVHGANVAECMAFAMTLAKEKKMMYINGFDHPNVLEGQGTAGIEILEQLPGVDAILIPVGGGGLIAGIAVAVKHLKPETEIYGIETDKCCSMMESLRKNERIFMDIDCSLADSLTVNRVGVNTFHNLKGTVDKMIVVKEEWVARAIMHLAEDEKFVVEGAGATGPAALMAGLLPNLKGKKVVCVLSGGNIDPTTQARAIERGMAAEGRLVKFKVTIADKAGAMAELLGLMAGIGVGMRDCIPERAWVKGDVFKVSINVIAETRGWEHTKELYEQVKKHYKEYQFQEMGDRIDKPTISRRGPCLAPNPVCMQK